MATTIKTPLKKAENKTTEEPKKLSKVGVFMKKNKGYIEIIDMRAVMK